MNAFAPVFGGILISVGSFLAAWAIATIIVEVADALGVVYSAEREAAAERRAEERAAARPRAAQTSSAVPSAIAEELARPAPDPRGGLSRRLEERRRAAA